MSLKILGFLAISVGAIIGLTIGLAMWTVQSWLAPLAPVLYLASIFFGLFIALALGWFVITRQELARGIGADGESVEERALKRLVMLVSQVLLAAVALGVVSLWNVDRVRAYFVEYATQSHVSLERPLRDPAGLVRLRACEAMFRRGWVYRSGNALVAALNPHPNVAQACLKTARENDWKGFRKVASDLGDGWEAEMLASGDLASAAICEYVPWTAPVDEIAELRPELRLLRCALGAESQAVRTCCGDALAAQGDVRKALADSENLSEEDVDGIFAALVQHGFQSGTLSAEQQKVAKALGLTDRETRRVLIDLGCSLLEPTRAQPEILRGFAPLVETSACGLSDEQKVEYSTPAAWVRLCGEITEAPPEQDLQTFVCESVAIARQEKAMDTARVHVHDAIRAPFMEAHAKFISDGLLAASAVIAQGGGGKSQKQVAYSQRSVFKELNLTGYDDPTCSKIVYGHGKSGLERLRGGYQIVDSYDCDRYDENVTAAEWMKRNPKTDIRDMLKKTRNPWETMRNKAVAEHGSNGNRVVNMGAKSYKEGMEEHSE